MLRLHHIGVAGYRSIRRQKIELRDLNVFIGANGSGKSNFLGVFRLLNELADERLQLFISRAGGADQILHFNRKVTDKLDVHLWFENVIYICTLVPTDDDSLVFEREVIKPHGIGDQSRRVGQRETQLKEGFAGISPVREEARLVMEVLKNWRVYHFHDTSSSAAVKQSGDLHDNLFLRPDAGNLAAFLYRLQETQPEAFRNMTNVVRMAAPFFASFQLQPDRLNPEKIRLEWRDRASDAYFNAHSLSDGTLRFICLATLLLQPELPSTVLLDEPELGLHPYAITVLADLLRSAATRTQVIVSTQSVTLVNQFGPEDILVVDREDGASVFRRLTSDQIESWLDDYALGELWEKNVLGGRPGA